MIALAVSLVAVVSLGVTARALDRLTARAGESRATRATRLLLWAVATVVVVEAVLGVLGWLRPICTSVALAVLAAGGFVLARRLRPRPLQQHPCTPSSPLTLGLLAACVALLAFRLWDGLHRTTFLYDTLSYHLHVPATWMHDRRISIVPAVFGDPSPAYAPSNLELWFQFLMAPLRSDYLAGVGQLPFAALAAIAIVAVHRENGGHRFIGVAAALGFLLVPEVHGQAPTAMSDLAFAALLLAALPFALRLWNATPPRRADLITFAAALGLAVGTKYAAAPLALPFAALGALGWLRHRPVDVRGAAAALAVLLATGGFWYLRNAIVTGNPFYPVAVPGLPLPALYGRAEMRAWEYHVPVGDLRALAAMWADAGPGFAAATALAVAGLARRLPRPGPLPAAAIADERRRRILLASLLVAVLSIFWFVLPYQESRFLFTVFAVAAVVIAQVAQRWPIALLGLAGALAGSLIQWPTRDRLLLVPIGAAVSLLFWRLGRPLPGAVRRAFGPAAAAAALALFMAIAAGAHGYARRDPGYTVGDDDLDAAWSWFRANVRDARVAYTGTNLAFPLAGDRLANRVGYVNVAGRPGDRLHDFGPPGDGTAEPAPYRRGARADAWIANLRAARTEVLFVAALVPIVRRTIAADADGFPIERAWADARPDLFHLRYASAAARVYAVEAR